MAANDFSASTITRLNIAVERMFAKGGFTQSHQNVPAVTAKALLSQQTGRANERLENGHCVGVKAFYLKGTSTKINSAPGCETPAGTKAESASVNYDNEVLTRQAASAEDNRCSNEVDFIQESSYQISNMIAAARQDLNNILIARVGARAGRSIYPANKLPAGWVMPASPSVDLQIPAADLTWRKLIHLRNIIAGNNFRNPLILTGSNYAEEMWDAMVKKDQACCEGGVYYAMKGMNMYFDDLDLEAALGVGHTYVVDRDNYLFWNATRSSANPTRVGTDADGEKWVWTINDPELTYFRDGGFAPVKYEVEMQKKCVGRDANDFLRYTYAFYLRLIGGFAFGPIGAETETGVLKIVKTS